MRAVYAVVLVVGFLSLVGWMVAHSLAQSTERPERDPEERLGANGRRVVGGMMGFGLAGMSAEFGSIELSAPVVALLAVAGGIAGAWWSGAMGGTD